MIQVFSLDHLVLTVADMPRTCEFYRTVLGMEVVTFGADRTALSYGTQKINLHPAKAPIAPHAEKPTVGAADLCFLIAAPLETAVAHLNALAVPIVAGPVLRTGATEPLRSIYIRDPDGNLLELSVSANEEATAKI